MHDIMGPMGIRLRRDLLSSSVRMKAGGEYLRRVTVENDQTQPDNDK